jgi:hypothetical protein
VRDCDRCGALSEPAYYGPGLLPYASEVPRVRVRMRDGYAEVLCDLSEPMPSAPQMWLVDGDGGNPIRSIHLERTGLTGFRGAVDLADTLGTRAAVMAIAHLESGATAELVPLNVTRVGGGRGGRTALPCGAELVTSAESFTDDVFVMTEVGDSTEAAPHAGLVPAGPPYRLEPATRFFNEPATLFLPVADDRAGSTRLGLYRRSGRSDWRLVGVATRDGGRLIGGDILHFSDFAVMEDVEPPRVYRMRPVDGARTRATRPALEVRVKDDGSGLDWEGVYFTIDGERLITGWEAETHYAWARPSHDLGPGRHDVEFFAADRAGNETVARASVFIVR